AGAQTRRGLFQQRVARFVAEGIVDEFEMVQVDEQDREAAVSRAGLGEGRRQGFTEGRPIGQLGETVVTCEEANALVGPLALSDVATDADDTDDVAGVIPKRDLVRRE